MTWRRTHLSGENVIDGRVPKSLGEQVQELQFATQRVIDLLETIKCGNLYWLGSLAVELRSLLHWRDKDFARKGVKYPQIPLLFRVAQ